MNQTRITPPGHERKGMHGPQVSYLHNKIHRFETVRGCPNLCPYCYEPEERQTFTIPEPLSDKAEILNMNTLYHPDPETHIRELGETFKELTAVCGWDYRLMTQEIADEIKKANFKRIYVAWDWGMDQQKKVLGAIRNFKKAGYSINDIRVFILINWKIPKKVCDLKLDFCLYHNLMVCNCVYDGQSSKKNIKPIHWTGKEIKDFRRKARCHSHLIRYGHFPEYDKCLKQ